MGGTFKRSLWVLGFRRDAEVAPTSRSLWVAPAKGYSTRESAAKAAWKVTVP
jgi:hypothetical protein